jgi:hypothetical protein
MSLTIKSQIRSTTLKTVNIIPPRDFYLNSQMRTDLLGGRQTHIVRVQLPPNTIEWYYAFSVRATQNDRVSLNVTKQLANIIDRTGLASVALSALYTPPGSYACDVYLMAGQNSAQSFANGNDGWRHYPNYRLTSTRNGVNVIKEKQFLAGTQYIGFKNPLSTQGINVTVEVVAIVEETQIDGNLWSKEMVDPLYDFMFEEMKKKYDTIKAKQMTQCFIDKVQQRIVPNDFKNMPKYKLEQVFQELGKECEID